ncbi:hypothetical protein [Lentibacillus halodurans]|nr:hypothetical protein [Lentibacillus halodurans]
MIELKLGMKKDLTTYDWQGLANNNPLPAKPRSFSELTTLL